MFRRCMLLMLAILLIGWGRPALALDQAEIYQAAQVELARYLGGESMGMTLDELCGLFESLGRYQKSPSFLYYASLLRDAEAERFDQLDVYVLLLEIDTDFGGLLQEADFPTVAEAEAYARGRMAEAVHDDKGAIAYYQQCGAMLDSLARMRTLLLATPAPTEVPTPTPTIPPTPMPTEMQTPTPTLPPTPTPTMKPTPAPTKAPTPAPTEKPTVTPVPVVVKKNVSAGDYKITTYSNGCCMITDYAGKATKLSVPGKINGYIVVAIGDYAFSNCRSLTSITIPDGVTIIGDFAFHYCTALTIINLPNGITEIGEYAFNYCTSLTDITLPNGITEIRKGTFNDCYSLSVIELPDGITAIGKGAFIHCESLTSITIPDGVATIENNAFEYCKSLDSIIIPDSVNYIGYYAFLDCSSPTLYVPQNSYAHQYAIWNKLTYTTY